MQVKDDRMSAEIVAVTIDENENDMIIG